MARPAAAWLAAGVLALAVAAPGARAAEGAAMGERVFRALAEAQGHVQEGRHARALEELAALRRRSLSPYEAAQVWNLTGYARYLQDDHPGAAAAYERVLDQPDLPEALLLGTLKTLAQLALMMEDYRAAVAHGRRLLRQVDDPDLEIRIVVAQAHYQLQEYAAARDQAAAAVAARRGAGEVPDEDWYQLLSAAQHGLEDYPGMAATLEALIRHYPKPRYIANLAAVYSELGQTRRQLALNETLYERGLLTRPEKLRNLASLYLLHDLPYKAGQLLAREMEGGRLEATRRNLELQAQAWSRAGEPARAAGPLARAAEAAGEGRLFVRLAQTHIDLRRWQEAERALTRALDLGGLDDRGAAWMMLGMTRYRQERVDAARESFRRAAESARYADAARRWLDYLTLEQDRRRQLEEAG